MIAMSLIYQWKSPHRSYRAHRKTDANDGAVLDAYGTIGSFAFTKGTCADGDTLDTHLVDLVHNHIYHIVTLTEVMVEGNGHAVLDLTFLPVPRECSPRSCFSSGPSWREPSELLYTVIIVSVSAPECFLTGCL